MPFDTQGNFSRLHSWEQDRLNDIEIVADRHDAEDDNFAEGLNHCFLRDGSCAMEGAIDKANFKINNVAEATAQGDAANYGQLTKSIGELREDLSQKVTAAMNNAAVIGDIKASLQIRNHGSWLLCNGQAVSRNEYAELFALIGTKFGSGDDSTTFNVPNYQGKFLRGLGGASAADFQTTQSEGLPNITGGGYWNFLNQITADNKSAIYGNENAQSHINHTNGDDHSNTVKFLFDASRSNEIYGASQHVTPINQAVNWFIKAKNEEI